MQVSASKIVRSLVTLSKASHPDNYYTVFNDSRSFGRSIKVWGWDESDYSNAKSWLELAGYKVRLVRTRKVRAYHFGSGGGKQRLWIYA